MWFAFLAYYARFEEPDCEGRSGRQKGMSFLFAVDRGGERMGGSPRLNLLKPGQRTAAGKM